MLAFLFRGLTAERSSGAALFDALTAEARRRHWYVEGELPDTLDGRFAILATVTALALVRLERDGDAGDRVSVALTERFIEVMESEHRELGLGDPTLGRVVRRLVGILARRTELWRAATRGDSDWAKGSRDSLSKNDSSAAALEHRAVALRSLWERLDRTSLPRLQEGALA